MAVPDTVGQARLSVLNLRKATTIPFGDPRRLSLIQAKQNPPPDLAASALFVQGRDHGLPLSVGRVRRTATAARSPSNVVIGSGGQTGTYIDDGFGQSAAYTGLRANHSGWNDTEFGFNQFQNLPLYAPTGHAPYSCLEVGSRYQPGFFPASVYVLDFCNPDRAGSKDPNDGTLIGMFTTLFALDDPSFRTNYEADFGDGVPSYSIEILRNPDGKFTAYFYNWVVGSWLPRYTSVSANFNPGFLQPERGWEIFEPKFVTGTCPSTPITEVSAAYGYNVVTNAFVDFGNIPGARQGDDIIPSCIGFDDQTAQGFYYLFTPGTTLGYWRVTSYPSYVPPPPPPPPGPCDDPASCCMTFRCSDCGFVDMCCDPVLDDTCCGNKFTQSGCGLSLPRQSRKPARQRTRHSASTKPIPAFEQDARGQAAMKGVR